MPVDHDNEGLKVAAGVIPVPAIDQLGADPEEMGIHHFPAHGAGIRPPVLGAVQRRRPADGDPRLIPDRGDNELGAAVGLRWLRKLHGP